MVKQAICSERYSKIWKVAIDQTNSGSMYASSCKVSKESEQSFLPFAAMLCTYLTWRGFLDHSLSFDTPTDRMHVIGWPPSSRFSNPRYSLRTDPPPGLPLSKPFSSFPRHFPCRNPSRCPRATVYPTQLLLVPNTLTCECVIVRSL